MLTIRVGSTPACPKGILAVPQKPWGVAMETWGGLLAQPQTLWFSSHHEAKRLDPLPTTSLTMRSTQSLCPTPFHDRAPRFFYGAPSLATLGTHPG